MSELTVNEQIVCLSLKEWAGWPDPEWFLGHIVRKHKIPEGTAQKVIQSLVSKGVIVTVTHKEQVVFRLE